ncbi:Gfo/Idh/MocA family protein [Cellulomonas fengjieae]|uniref:Gfo/Idh/MocA family oxidoreductase n=1 Tax=Cellulomonas fengjieae TaxID=2819978 RepID=A0ABS3SBS0_9CELL|nr:Gfo/Idh/MocA family oxidoreductase [Cellulomonas fengjieae]MBO3083193.1 Gfo/Idh/MocA family oxidoreductase [Cellulomonas fengjieae]MBO3102060.1 Gfo/Idh/MocA family oxidoreductase [Cellulomonas fengjieae]QVI65450.1 Gfo/Idh/MocA family oxidoreductase [Cellulomonas fengjieae]
MTDQNPTAPRPASSSSTTAGPGVVPEFAPPPDGDRRRYAVAGTGHRAGMYIDAITGEHADVATLVALLDTNPGRMAHYEQLVSQALGRPARLAQYAPDGLEKMIAEQSVDVVIVTAPDHAHAELVARALAAGADVVVEKPLTVDRAGCRRITGAVAETGRDVVMTFNYRYAPRNSSLRQVIASGEIGEVTSVHFEWALDTVHGADYFRRWHREKRNSGGLLVHKSSHHFDLVNWWLGDVPARVYARGGLRFYGDHNAADRGLGPRPARGTGVVGDPFTLDLNDDPRLRSLYLDAEVHDGYLRDQDVFGPGITIEDNLALLVDYQRGATLTYSLNAHSPWEGYRATVNGTAGRAELEVVERGAIELDEHGNAVLDPSATPSSVGDALRPEGERLLVQKHWERATAYPIPDGIGGHGGGDAILLKDVFRRHLRLGEDALGRPAGYLDGLRAVAVGIAGNQSMVTGLPVTVADLDLGADLSLEPAR